MRKVKWKIKQIVRRRIKGEFMVWEIIDITYEKLKKKYSYQTIPLHGSEFALIAEDRDWHRVKRGYTEYDSVILVRSGENIWALGKGRACGSYPADPYNKDILVLKVWESILRKTKTLEEIAEEIMPWIRMSFGFQNSIIAGKRSGELFVGSKWRDKVKELIAPELPKFIRKELETHEGYLTVELGEMSPSFDIVPAIKSPIMYKKKLADFLAKKIIEILSDS